jgi:hypothetical protein
VDDPFDFQGLRVQQPGKLLPNRARYEIYSDHRQLLAIAAETEAHHRVHLLARVMPDARVLSVTTAASEPMLTMIKQRRERVTELQDPDGALVGRIRATQTTRHYTLSDHEDRTIGLVVGDLALKRFPVTTEAGREYARIEKTWAGLKEMLTPSDHYKVQFTGPTSAAGRLFTVMMTIVLDLTLYGPM